METVKKYYGYIAGFIGAIVGLLFLRNYFQKGLKADAKLADNALKSAVIDAKLEGNATAQADLNNAATALQESLKEDLKAQSGMSTAEAEQFWSRRGK